MGLTEKEATIVYEHIDVLHRMKESKQDVAVLMVCPVHSPSGFRFPVLSSIWMCSFPVIHLKKYSCSHWNKTSPDQLQACEWESTGQPSLSSLGVILFCFSTLTGCFSALDHLAQGCWKNGSKRRVLGKFRSLALSSPSLTAVLTCQESSFWF